MSLRQIAIAAAFTVAAATQVHAAPLLLGDTVTVSDQNSNSFTPSPIAGDSNGLYKDVTIKLNNGAAQSSAAGLFVLNHQHVGTSWEQFLSFCLEPNKSLTPFDNPYSVQTIAAAGYSAAASLISELWGRYFNLVNNDTKAAAFQVALWELAFDGNKNLSTGTFQLVSDDGVKSQAQSWLDSLDGTGAKADDLVVLAGSQNNKQDLLTVGQKPPSQVPEPSALALLGLGLAGLGLARRRTRRHTA